MPAFVLKIKDIEEGGRDFRFDLPVGWLEGALEGADLRPQPDAAHGSVRVFAQHTGGGILVQGSVRASVVGQCVRCLGDAPLAVEGELTALMKRRGAASEFEQGDALEVELTPEDLTKEFFSGDQIVLDELVREQILLECPMQPLCSETCPGIDLPEHLGVAGFAPHNDQGRAIDPRLAPLMKIARQLGQNEE